MKGSLKMEGQKQEGYQETAFGEYKRKVVECLMKDEGLLGHYLGLTQFTSHIAICDVTSFWKGSALIPSALLPS